MFCYYSSRIEYGSKASYKKTDLFEKKILGKKYYTVFILTEELYKVIANMYFIAD